MKKRESIHQEQKMNKTKQNKTIEKTNRQTKINDGSINKSSSSSSSLLMNNPFIGQTNNKRRIKREIEKNPFIKNVHTCVIFTFVKKQKKNTSKRSRDQQQQQQQDF